MTRLREWLVPHVAPKLIVHQRDSSTFKTYLRSPAGSSGCRERHAYRSS